MFSNQHAFFKMLTGRKTNLGGKEWSNYFQGAGEEDNEVVVPLRKLTNWAPFTAVSSQPCTAAPREQHPTWESASLVPEKVSSLKSNRHQDISGLEIESKNTYRPVRTVSKVDSICFRS